MKGKRNAHRLLLLVPFLLAVAGPARGQEPTPYRFGYFAANMRREVEMAIVHAAAAEGRQPWALFAEWGPVNGDPHIDVFYPATFSTGRLRRGEVRTFRCSSRGLPRECLHWESSGKPRTYVQIAEKAMFTTSLRPRTAGEKPIMLTGAFSDADLLSLVEYVRSNRSVLPQFSMCGDEAIWKIVRKTQGAVSVIFSDDSIGGCTATMRQTAGQWEVGKCGCWVS